MVRQSFDRISGKATVSDFVAMLARRRSRHQLRKMVAERHSLV